MAISARKLVLKQAITRSRTAVPVEAALERGGSVTHETDEGSYVNLGSNFGEALEPSY